MTFCTPQSQAILLHLALGYQIVRVHERLAKKGSQNVTFSGLP